MDTCSLRLNQQNRAFTFLGIFSVLLLTHKGSATEFTVGGADGWKVPSSDPNALHYNQWSERNRFTIGDSLVFVYPPEKDSVLRVTEEEYTNCNIETPIEKFSDGHTVFKLTQSGRYYFTSGIKDNCLKNEKMVVAVQADSSNSTQTPPVSPPPSNSTDMIPSPAPPGELAPSPPSSDQPPPPPPNGASMIFIGLTGSFGAFISSYILLVF